MIYFLDFVPAAPRLPYSTSEQVFELLAFQIAKSCVINFNSKKYQSIKVFFRLFGSNTNLYITVVQTFSVQIRLGSIKQSFKIRLGIKHKLYKVKFLVSKCLSNVIRTLN